MRAVMYWYLISLQVPRTHPVELQRERQLGDNNGHAIQSLSSLHVAEWNSSSPFYCYDVFNKKTHLAESPQITGLYISPNSQAVWCFINPSTVLTDTLKHWSWFVHTLYFITFFVNAENDACLHIIFMYKENAIFCLFNLWVRLDCYLKWWLLIYCMA